MKCTHCASTEYVKNGWMPGKQPYQRYQCKKCLRNFGNPSGRRGRMSRTGEDTAINCTHCASAEYVKYGRAGGNPRYKCKKCLRTFGEPSARKASPPKTSPGNRFRKKVSRREVGWYQEAHQLSRLEYEEGLKSTLKELDIKEIKND